MLFAIAPALPAQDNANTPALKAYVISKPADKAAVEATKNQLNSFIGPGPTLPLWTFTIDSSRDGSNYSGVIVGTDPFSAPASTSVPTYIQPLIVRTNTVGTAIDPKTLTIKTTSGATTFNPLGRITVAWQLPTTFHSTCSCNPRSSIRRHLPSAEPSSGQRSI